VTESTWADWVDTESRAIRETDRWREPRDLDASGMEGGLAPDGRPVVAFASNDYLGLRTHPAVVRAAHAALDRWGTGAGSARLIVGALPVHGELETELAAWKESERAVLFSTGFAANLGVLGTFARPGTLVVSEAWNHASIIDGCRLGGAEVAVSRHADPEHVDALLRDRGDRRAVVVTDTVFSMDGEIAPIPELVDLCARRGALLVLDEAHAVIGPDPQLDGVDALRVGTLSKTLGSLGGFVAGPRHLCELLVNRARSYIFTTASTPADTAAALAALAVVRSSEGDELRNRLRGHIETLRAGHPTPIIPYVLGEESVALTAAAALLGEGFLVPAVRPPTVPPGTSRLRVTVSAAHTDEQVLAFRSALERVLPIGTTVP
jgi:8-amino-7-oxononanoate synthase